MSIIHDVVLAEIYSYNMGTLRMLSGKVTAETEKLFKENLTRYKADIFVRIFCQEYSEAYFLLGGFGSVGGRQSRACFLSAI